MGLNYKERFYKIQNHEDGYHHYFTVEKVRQYRYELVDKVDENGNNIYGFFKYDDAPCFIHRGFYHVKDANLGAVWWRTPSAVQRLELLARYPTVVF